MTYRGRFERDGSQSFKGEANTNGKDRQKRCLLATQALDELDGKAGFIPLESRTLFPLSGGEGEAKQKSHPYKETAYIPY